MQEGSDRLLKLLKQLRIARDVHGWDLADFCLDRCATPIEQIAKLVSSKNTETEITSTAETQVDVEAAPGALSLEDSGFTESSFFDDLFIPTESFDYPWEALWDNMEGL